MAIEKIENIITNKEIPANTELDLTTTNTYLELKDAEENRLNVEKELADAAKCVTPEEPVAPEVKSDSIYTKKLVLDESVEEFKGPLSELSDDSDEDEYLDYDMFNFIYGIVTDSWPKPKNPLNHPIRKFQYTGEDDYIITDSNKGVPQVSTDLDDNIVVYAQTAADFNDIKAVCDHYHIKYRDVKPRMSKDSHWAFNMTIEVPKTSGGYPMMVEDFFEPYGLSLEDVIEDHKVGQGKSANWGKTYTKKVTKDRAELNDIQNSASVEKIYKKYHDEAAWSNDPLDGFLKRMFAELDGVGLKYSKSAIKKRFLADFEDDFESDSEE